jgi:hypothetical protein
VTGKPKERKYYCGLEWSDKAPWWKGLSAEMKQRHEWGKEGMGKVGRRKPTYKYRVIAWTWKICVLKSVNSLSA